MITAKKERSDTYIQNARKADAEALNLKNLTKEWNRDDIETHVTKHRPSPQVIASLLWGLQRTAAQKSRRDALSKELYEIVKKQRNIPIETVMERLRSNALPGFPIYEVTEDDTVKWMSGREYRETTKSEVAKRVSRLRTGLKRENK
jgi:hypothetical protein